MLVLSLLMPSDNVLVIVADDMGPELVAAYGVNPQPTRTPRIDALAEQGVLFRRAWGYSRCSPTRAAMLTGRFGFHTGIGSNVTIDPDNFAVQLSEFTLPEALDATHATACFGKWHMGNATVGGDLSPNLAGYDHFAGTLDVHRKPEEWFEFDKLVNGETVHVVKYRTTDIVDDAVAWLDTAPEPWFCMVNFNNPHPPVHDPPEHLHTYEPPLVGFDAKQYAMVEAMDTEIGRLLDSIDAAGTTVIFLGDNGSEMKGTLYEGGVNIPFIVAGPAVVNPGRETVGLVHAVDVYGTVLRLAGVGPLPPGLDSISFKPFLEDVQPGSPASKRVRRLNFTERFKPNGLGTPIEAHRTVRNADYKLIRREAFDELYDMDADPFETTDLLLDPELLTPHEIASYDFLSAELEALLDS